MERAMWLRVGGILWLVAHLSLVVVSVATTETYLLHCRERFNLNLPILPERQAIVPIWWPAKGFRLYRQYYHLLFRRQSGQDVERERRRAILSIKVWGLWLTLGWIIVLAGAGLDTLLSRL